MTLLSTLGNPNLAILLILAGIFLIYAEFNRPGNVVLGSGGTLAAMLGIYGLAQHSISLVAIFFLIAGVAFLLFALRYPRAPSIAKHYRNGWVQHSKVHGLAPLADGLALVATAAIVYGLCILTSPPIHPLVAFATGTAFVLVTLPLARIALRARRNKCIVRKPAPNLQPSPRPLAE